MKYIYRDSDKAVLMIGDVDVPVGCSSVEIASATKEFCTIKHPGIPIFKVNDALDDTENRTEQEIADEIDLFNVGYYLKFDNDGNVIGASVFNALVRPYNNGLLFDVDDLPEGFIVDSNIILDDEYGYKKWKYNSGSIVARTEAERVADFQADKISSFKVSAASELSALDWKCIRHRDQVDNSEATSLTSQEYTDLLNERKAIRDKSNNKETAINACSTMAQIHVITWDSIEE